ncbi:MAG TPA: ester cyclase, partial [Polyangiaceae bacterium]|nr:ester cyclase [Polyangiaceae bacterium]
KGERLLTLINGNHVASIALLTGTQTGPLNMGMGPAIPATGKKTGHMMLHWGEFTPAGQLSKQWIEADTPTMLAHLGVSKAPARPVISKLPAEAQVVIAKNDDKEAKNVEIHKKGYELFNAKNPAFSDLLGEGLMEHDYSMPADAMGKKTMTSKLQGMWKGFSDIHLNMDEVWGAGDYTFVRGHMTGTNDGDMPMMKLKKTGKKVDVAFGEVAQWDNGKLKTIYFFMDGMDMAGQLGLLAPPPAAAPAAQPAAAQPAAKPAPAPAAAPAPAVQPAAKPAPAPAAAPAPAPAKK